MTGQQVIANGVKYGVVGAFLLMAPVATFSNDSVGRAVAFVAIGLVAGMATGLIENIADAEIVEILKALAP